MSVALVSLRPGRTDPRTAWSSRTPAPRHLRTGHACERYRIRRGRRAADGEQRHLAVRQRTLLPVRVRDDLPVAAVQRGRHACAEIGGATGRFYTVQAADAGSRLRAMETMSIYDCGAHDTSTGAIECRWDRRNAPSGMTDVVPGGAPTPPTRRRRPRLPPVRSLRHRLLPPRPRRRRSAAWRWSNRALTATRGTWSGSQPLTIGLEWLRCDPEGENCQGLGITASTYTVGAVDVGKTIRVKITAANLAGARGRGLRSHRRRQRADADRAEPEHRRREGDRAAQARDRPGQGSGTIHRQGDARHAPSQGLPRLPRRRRARLREHAAGNALVRPAEFTTGADGLVTLEFKRGTKLRAAIKAVTVVVIARRPGDKPASPRGAIVRLKLPVAAAARR